MRQSEAALFLPIIQAWANGDDLYFKGELIRDNQPITFNAPVKNYTTKPKQWYRVAKKSKPTESGYYTFAVDSEAEELANQESFNFVEWLTPRVYY